MKIVSTFALALALGLPATSFVLADDAHHSAEAAQSAKGETPAAAMSEGEVKKIDKDAGKITIKHGELKNLAMPPMTMAFRIRDSALMEQVKVGDQINFVAQKDKGQIIVTRIEVKK